MTLAEARKKFRACLFKKALNKVGTLLHISTGIYYKRYIGTSIAKSVAAVEQEEGLPTAFQLMQNYPNPFNPTTTISYQIPVAGYVSLKVYDMLGCEIAILVNENKSVGIYSVTFNASNLPAGIYFYRMQARKF